LIRRFASHHPPVAMARPPSTPTPLPTGPERLRRFTDAENVQWAAWEVEVAYIAENAARLQYLAPELAGGWVAFESDRGERRRLAPVPEGWYEAEPSGLLGLLERADVVHERRTPLHTPAVPMPPLTRDEKHPDEGEPAGGDGASS
jgi:hypothetical protein